MSIVSNSKFTLLHQRNTVQRRGYIWEGATFQFHIEKSRCISGSETQYKNESGLLKLYNRRDFNPQLAPAKLWLVLHYIKHIRLNWRTFFYYSPINSVHYYILILLTEILNLNFLQFSFLALLSILHATEEFICEKTFVL